MTVTSLLSELRRLDVQVWVDGDQLKCNAPAGVLTPDLRDVLRQRKSDVIEFLRSAEAVARQQRAVVPLQTRGSRVPLFAVPGHNGDVFLYRALATHLSGEQPLYGLQPPGLEDGREPLTTVESLAAYFAAQIRGFQPRGPIALGGYCAGATIAYELARQLETAGVDVRYVAMFAGAFPSSYHRLPQFVEHCTLRLRRARKRLATLNVAFIRERLTALANAHKENDPVLHSRHRMMRITAAAVAAYEPHKIRTRACLVFPSRGCVPERSMLQWHNVTNVENHYGPDGCEGDVMLLEPQAAAFAEILRRL